LSPPSVNPAAAYTWTYPGCPLRVLFSLAAIDRLHREMVVSASPDRELGGLLIGRKQAGITRVVDFVALPGASHPNDQHFSLPPQWLAEVKARCPSGCEVVGYFRSDADRFIRLRLDDLERMQQHFGDPSDVCLITAPSHGQGINAGFFCWQAGSIGVNPNLTFPLSVAELSSSGWPIQDEGSWKEKIAGFFSEVAFFFSEIPSFFLKGGEAKVAIKVAALSAVTALFLTALVTQWLGSADHPRRALGLQVQGDGNSFSLSWNPEAAAIKSAKEATLVIWDASRSDADGETEPLHLPIPLARLKSGSMTYTSFGLAKKVQFRLDVINRRGDLRSERATYQSSPEPIARQPQPPAQAPPLRRRSPSSTQEPADVAVAAKDQTPVRKFTPPSIAERPRTFSRIVIPEPPPDIFSAPDKSARAEHNQPVDPPAAAAGESDSPPAANLSSKISASPVRPYNPSLPGMVTITSEPSGAEVQINSVPAGLTPVTVQISPVGLGFTVTVSKAGYATWSLQTFATEKAYSLHAQLKEASR